MRVKKIISVGRNANLLASLAGGDWSDLYIGVIGPDQSGREIPHYGFSPLLAINWFPTFTMNTAMTRLIHWLRTSSVRDVHDFAIPVISQLSQNTAPFSQRLAHHHHVFQDSESHFDYKRQEMFWIKTCSLLFTEISCNTCDRQYLLHISRKRDTAILHAM